MSIFTVQLFNQIIMADKEKRKHVFKHRDYLRHVADRLVTTNPTVAIVESTLEDLYVKAFEEGYITRIEDSRYFKEKREQHRINSFNMIRDHVSDVIGNKEERPKRQRINQKKK